MVRDPRDIREDRRFAAGEYTFQRQIERRVSIEAMFSRPRNKYVAEYYHKGGWIAISPSGDQVFAEQEARQFREYSPLGRDGVPVRVIQVLEEDGYSGEDTRFYEQIE